MGRDFLGKLSSGKHRSGVSYTLASVCIVLLLATCAMGAYPDLTDTVAPNPAPSAPTGWDTFTPPVDTQTPPAGSPVIAEWTRTAGPDTVVTVTGTSLSASSGADFGKDTRFITYGQTTSGDGAEKEGSIHRLTTSTAHIATSSTLQTYSMYLMWPKNSNGVGYPVAINRAEAWWLGPTALITRGDTVAVYGRNLSHDGGTTTSWVYIKPAGSAGAWATVTEVDPYRVAFTVPASCTNGTYEVWIHNGHGGAYGWSGPLSLTVTNGHTWSANVYNVRSYGATGNGTTDDYDAIVAARAASAGDPWSTVYFPAGTYAVRSSISPYPYQKWLGDGMNSTYIIPHSTYNNVYALIFPGANHAMMQDLTVSSVYANYNYIDTVYWRGGEAVDVQFLRVRFDNAWGYALDMSAGTDIVIKDCDIYGQGNYFGPAKGVFFDGTDFYGRSDANVLLEGWGYENLSVIRCTAQDADNSDPNSGWGWAQGRWVSGNGVWGSNRNTYIGHSATYDMAVRWGFSNMNTGEQLMWEGNNTGYSGTPTSATSTTVTFSNLTTDYSGGKFDATIVSGKGLGQHRKVTAFNSGTKTITVSPAWRVTPDTTSKVVIGCVTERCAIYDNDLDGKADHVAGSGTASAAIVPYGGCLDFIAQDNTVTDCREGIASWSLGQPDMTPDSMQPTYFGYYANNSITNSKFAIRTAYAFTSDTSVDPGAGYMANIFRGNTINGTVTSGIEVYDSWDTQGVPYESNVFEHNTITNTPYGINNYICSDGMPTGDDAQDSLFYKNNISRGTAALSGSKGISFDTGQNPALRQNTWTGFETTYAGNLPGAILEIPNRVVDLSASIGGSNVTKVLPIWNSGTSSMSWTATSSQTWLTVSPTSGSIAGENNSTDLTITCNPNALTPGTYTGAITVTQGSQSKKIGVTFVVSAPANYSGSFTLAFGNPGFETQGTGGASDADIWYEISPAHRELANQYAGVACMHIDKPSSPCPEIRYGLGTWQHTWNAATRSGQVNASPGTVAAYTFKAKNASAGATWLPNFLTSNATMGYANFGYTSSYVNSTSYATYSIAVLRNRDMSAAWDASLAYRMYLETSGSTYVDNFTGLDVIRPEVSISNTSIIDLGTVAPNTQSSASTARTISNSQTGTAPNGGTNVASILYGTMNVTYTGGQTWNQTCDDVGGVIIGTNASLFKFVTTHYGVNNRELKLIGADGIAGLPGGSSPETESLSVQFLGTATPGVYTATVRICTNAGNMGVMSTGLTGEPMSNLCYVDIPVTVTVQ